MCYYNAGIFSLLRLEKFDSNKLFANFFKEVKEENNKLYLYSYWILDFIVHILCWTSLISNSLKFYESQVLWSANLVGKQ